MISISFFVGPSENPEGIIAGISHEASDAAIAKIVQLPIEGSLK